MKYIHILSAIFFLLLFNIGPDVTAQDQTTTVTNNSLNSTTPIEEPIVFSSPPSDPVILNETTCSGDFVKKAWELSGKNDLVTLGKLAEECSKIHAEEARRQASLLQDFPVRGTEKDYEILNNLATIFFIKAEALMNNGKTEEAIAQFQKNIEDYRWAQAWDPSRGAFWSIAEKSRASMDVMLGKMEEKEAAENVPGVKTFPPMFNPGKEKVIDYKEYGDFVAVGTKDYKYVIKNPKALAEAVGYGIYPSSTNVSKSEVYSQLKKEGRLQGSHWDSLLTTDLEAAYFKWLNAPEPVGIRLYYQGIILERAKMYPEAIKAYHSLIVHFPSTVAWTYWHTPWYPAQAAVSKIQHILRTHPELNLTPQWMKIEVVNGYDNEVGNDLVLTWPGIIKEKASLDRFKEKLSIEKKTVPLGKTKRTLGTGQVRLKQYANNHWQLLVDDKPFVIRGMTYAPTKVGQSADKKTLVSWMQEDSNNNDLLDGPYESWVDQNRNNIQDVDEPVVGDFKLLKDMGVNTLREYYQPFVPKKDILRKMYKEYGFKVIMGNFLGKYTHGSGATWFEGTSYSNPVHQAKMMNSVKEMVLEFKDEPYILFWLLGNENNFGVANNADKDPVAYYKFMNDIAKMIHELDPNHPIAACNGDTLFLDIFAKHAPEVDIFGANLYRGDYGFGAFWEQVQGATGKPAFVTEYGAPAFTKYLSLAEGELEQANYHRGNWLDIENNLGGRKGVGNALGGVVFEWMDEWWKNYEPFYHDKKSDTIGPFAGGYYFEEWFGITAQGNGKHSPFLRQLRQTYDAYKEMWNSKP